MNYTEEEFFGNKQNEQPQEEQEEKIDVGGTIFSTCIKTFALLICAVFYVFAVSVCFVPRTAIKIYEFLGAKNAVIVCYERIYQKTGSLADLYNLVQKAIEAKDYEKTSKYITELQAKSDYTSFCTEVNQASIQVSENRYVAYVGDLDGYLVSQNILALYTSGNKEKALNKTKHDLINNPNIYSFGVSTYVNCVLADSALSEEQKASQIKNFYELVIEHNSVVQMVGDYIDEQRALVDKQNATGLNKVDLILRVYTCLKIDNVKLKYFEIIQDENSANAMRLQIEELQDLYETLVG